MPELPLFSWLAEWRPDQLRGTLKAIFIADSAGGGMCRVPQIEAIAGAGLKGDRYATGRGHWRQTDACAVTLVTEEDLRKAERRGGMSFSAGEHRRNLVVSGIPLGAFRQNRLRIGGVLFDFHRLRPPCGYLDRLLRPGAGRALGRGAGIGLTVVEGGVLREGDAAQVFRPSGWDSPRTG